MRRPGLLRGLIPGLFRRNSKEGGALVPTIAFGVPGSVSMAILLGAFVIQGITPGPDMLDPAKHMKLTFAFVVTIFSYAVYEGLWGFGAVSRRAALFPLAIGLSGLVLSLGCTGTALYSLRRFGKRAIPGLDLELGLARGQDWCWLPESRTRRGSFTRWGNRRGRCEGRH